MRDENGRVLLAPKDFGVASSPTMSPTILDAEEIHEEDAYAAVFLNVTIILCILLAYCIKKYRIYFLPESAAAMIMGVVIGGLVRLFLNDLSLYQFSPEFFFFVLLPPIIFEAGYSLEKKQFFENIGSITLYAMFGTIISTVIVGFLTFKSAQAGLISGVSQTNPMEALLFASLISAVDPVATLSIMSNPELQCNKLLYSLVFGESVLNDAIAIVLFKTFHKYYDPTAPNLTSDHIPRIFADFLSMTILSIVVGVVLGLLTSAIYKNTAIRKFANLESTLLFLFCYLCYATAESLELSGIMALFFNGIVLGHYNRYNLSNESKHATEQIFVTLATISETAVFLYMGMGVFTDKFSNWNIKFSLYAMLFCVIGRFFNIIPLSLIANFRRHRKSSKITMKMQVVLWFAGLRGAIAYALAENMPGDNRETYVCGTLTICIMTTVFCGGFTERILTVFEMKEDQSSMINDEEENEGLMLFSTSSKEVDAVYDGVKKLMVRFDENFLMVYFGGSKAVMEDTNSRINQIDERILRNIRAVQSTHDSGYDDDDDGIGMELNLMDHSESLDQDAYISDQSEEKM